MFFLVVRFPFSRCTFSFCFPFSSFALAIRFSALSNPSVSLFKEGDSLIYRINECRVQTARKNKGMPFHPCASPGFIEHDGFARVIDERIVTEMISCYPNVTDPECACCWKFTLR